MAVIPNGAKIPKRWKLIIESDGVDPASEFQGHTSAIEFPSNQTAQTWKGGDGNNETDVAEGDQLCNLTVAQDLTPGSLYRVMWDNAGKSATLTYWPEHDGDFGVESTITLLRPPLKTDRAGQRIEHTVACPATPPVPVAVV